MKSLLIILMLFCAAYSASAQKAISNIDTVYYLLDTTKTPLKDRMWDIGIEERYKYYTIQCPCLKFNNSPTFVYNLKEGGTKMSGDQIARLSFVSLSSLIERAKAATDLTATTLYIFYIIEKNAENEYISHKMSLLPPRQPVKYIDYDNITPVVDKKTKGNRH